MNRLSTMLTATVALTGAVVAVPTQASANPLLLAPGVIIVHHAIAAWVAPTIAAAAIGGVALGAAATHAGGPIYPAGAAPAALPPGSPAALPPEEGAPGCYFTHARIEGVWHRVQVCD
jgi:hypothetical protein